MSGQVIQEDLPQSHLHQLRCPGYIVGTITWQIILTDRGLPPDCHAPHASALEGTPPDSTSRPMPAGHAKSQVRKLILQIQVTGG